MRHAFTRGTRAKGPLLTIDQGSTFFSNNDFWGIPSMLPGKSDVMDLVWGYTTPWKSEPVNLKWQWTLV